MKTKLSREAQNAFGNLLDTAQREPVMVTRRNHSVGRELPIENMPALLKLANNMREKTIKAGVKAGLVDAEAGCTHELTDDYIAEVKLKAKQRIKTNKSK